MTVPEPTLREPTLREPTLREPTLRELASRVVMASFTGPVPPPWLLRRLEAGLGSVCLFGSNLTGSDAQVRALTDTLHAAGGTALVAIDEEGGDVTRLDARRGSPLPGPAALGAAGSPDLTHAVLLGLGRRLAACGVDLDLAPVADVNSDPANPVIGVRSFGEDPDTVAAHVAAAIRGLQDAGVAACAKHFPGHGDTGTDSHLALPVLDVPAEVLARRDLPPFRAAVDAGVAAVMTGHLLVRALDPDRPASTSPAVTALLRSELRFRGVIVTDALDMAGVGGGADGGGGDGAAAGRLPAAAVAALTAGADLLCLGAGGDEADVDGVVAALVAAVTGGRLPGGRLEEAADRVLALGRQAQARRAGAGPDPDAGPDPGPHAQEAARAAVSVDGPVPDLAGAAVVRLVTEPGIAVGAVPWGAGPALAALLPGVSCLDAGPDDDVDAVLGLAGGRPLVAVVRSASRTPWVAGALERLAAARPDLVTVEMGWPAPGRLPGRTVVHTRGASTAAATAAARVLAGPGAAGGAPR